MSLLPEGMTYQDIAKRAITAYIHYPGAKWVPGNMVLVFAQLAYKMDSESEVVKSHFARALNKLAGSGILLHDKRTNRGLNGHYKLAGSSGKCFHNLYAFQTILFCSN